jgi:hypothetical protein
LDRETLVALLGERDDLDRHQAESIVGKVESAIAAITSRFGGGDENGHEDELEHVEAVEVGVSDDYGYARQVSRDEADGEDAERSPAARAKASLRSYLDGLDRPELRYDVLRRDLRRILDDPRASGEVLSARMHALSTDSLRALVG